MVSRLSTNIQRINYWSYCIIIDHIFLYQPHLNPLIPSSFNSTWPSWFETTQLLERRAFYRVLRFFFPPWETFPPAKSHFQCGRGEKGGWCSAFLEHLGVFFSEFSHCGCFGLFVPSGVEAWFSCVSFCLLCFLSVFFRAIQSKNKPAPTKIEGVMIKKQHDLVGVWEVILINRMYFLCLIILVKLRVATSQ